MAVVNDAARIESARPLWPSRRPFGVGFLASFMWQHNGDVVRDDRRASIESPPNIKFPARQAKS